jgi:hypothetical protein
MMGSKAFSCFILWPYVIGFHCMLEQLAYCAFSLSLFLLFNKVIFNFAKDVGMYACLWHEYFVILMGFILYAKHLCLVWSKKISLFWKIVNWREKNSLNLCACVCLKWYFPLWALHTQMLVNEFWGYLLSCVLVWWRWVWCLWLIPFYVNSFTSSFEFCEPFLVDYPF